MNQREACEYIVKVVSHHGAKTTERHPTLGGIWVVERFEFNGTVTLYYLDSQHAIRIESDRLDLLVSSGQFHYTVGDQTELFLLAERLGYV